MSAWANFPTSWIIAEKKLNNFSWQKQKGDATAALLVLIALSIKRNTDKIGKPTDQRAALAVNEYVKATYDEIQDIVDISRSKVARGLALLMRFNIIERTRENISCYRIVGIGEPGMWGKLPQGILVRSNRLVGFHTFSLRSKHELNALKLYLLMLAFRNGTTSYASLGYSAFSEYSGVAANDVKKAKSHLINLNLISVETTTEYVTDKTKPSMIYKLIGL